MRYFFDSNVIVYLVSADAAKADRSQELLDTGGWISVQVLNEVAHVSSRKMRHDWSATLALLDDVRAFVHVSAMTPATHETGLAVAERYRFSIWDSMIVASALEAGCDTLYSEDMHDGLVIDDRLRIEDPYRAQDPR